ncbi:hypothetical protein [Actinomadura scrupuli]|uniref:hypothetical protein n=1 Tax=Actinomadura scrupuli TaxID=559629 RepID=UPI003D982E9E
MAARDLTFVEDALAGPDLSLRRAALRAVRTLPVSDEAAAAVLADASAELRSALYRTLLHGGRETLADRLLPVVRARWGDREAAMLLAACGGPVVSRWLPELAHAVTSWKTLGKRHPAVVLDVAERELGAGGAWRWRRRRADVLASSVHAQPERVLTLLELHDLGGHAAELPSAVLGALFKADAVRTARLIGGSRRWHRPPAVLKAHLRVCSDQELSGLVRTDSDRIAEVMKALPPGRREAVFDAVSALPSASYSLWALPLLGLLPAERAAAEARRMLEWHASAWHSSRSMASDPDLPLRLTSYLPYEEAAGPVTDAATGGDPRRRSLARTLLVECTARTGDPALFAALVSGLAQRMTGERDPLRGALLTTLAGLRPALFTDACAPALEKIAADAVEARDSSPATRDALRSLAGRVLRHHRDAALTAWALGVYEKLVARFGADGLGLPPAAASRPVRARRRRVHHGGEPAPHRLDLVLRRGQEQQLLEELRPHLLAARQQRDYRLVVALARLFGRRSRHLGEVQDGLREAILQAPESCAREAADLWLAEAGERDERVAALVREDPSTLILPRVWRTVAERRTDLLVPLLRGDRRGHLAGANALWVPEISSGTVGRWTPAQRASVRALLTGIAGHAGAVLAVRTSAVRAMAFVPGDPATLATWASAEETVLAEAALEALGGTDTPAEALTALFPHARGRSSPVAVAAIARCCRAMPPSLLGPVLEQALFGPDSKVTLRKEAVRQLSRNRPPGAVDLLLRAWDEPDLHRDVRVAVAVALRSMPEDRRSLEALTEAAGRHAGELMLRTLFQAQPWEYAPAHRSGYADLVRRLLAAADGPGVRFRGARAFATWAPWYRGGFDQIIEAVADPVAPGDAADMQVFLALLKTGTIREQTLDVLRSLITGRPDSTEPDRVGCDSPARERMKLIVGRLSDGNSHADEREPWRAALARDAVSLLAADPFHLPQAAEICVALLPIPHTRQKAAEPGELGDGLCELADLLRGRPVLTVQTSTSIERRLRSYRGTTRVEPAELLAAARSLIAQDHLAADLLAVTVTRTGGERAGWTSEWRETLHGLRLSARPEVSQRAWDIAVHRP